MTHDTALGPLTPLLEERRGEGPWFRFAAKETEPRRGDWLSDTEDHTAGGGGAGGGGAERSTLNPGLLDPKTCLLPTRLFLEAHGTLSGRVLTPTQFGKRCN